MFAEELSGNASKKRQEEARARRRQLKQQQQERQVATATTPSPSFTATDSSTKTLTVSSVSVASTLVLKDAPKTDNLEGTSANAAVQNALQQRQLRHRAQLETSSVVCIQSFYRTHRSNTSLLRDQAQILSSRLKDLITLHQLIKQKTKADYIPPPATASVLICQLLFLTRTLSYRRADRRRQCVIIRSYDDIVRIEQCLQYVLLPGIEGKDSNLDPLLPWPPYRLLEVIRLALTVVARPGVSENTLRTVDHFLRVLVGTEKVKARASVIQEARHHLFPVTPLAFADVKQDDHDRHLSSFKTKPYPHSNVGSTVDILRVLRHHLLFAKGDPIPNDASRLREGCFTDTERLQTDVLFLLVLDGMQAAPNEQWRYHTRFITEIMTVPLLTWKTSVDSTASLLSGSPKPAILSMIKSVTDHHGETLSAGKVATLLPHVDVPLTSCPATNTQCLLANLVHVGRACSLINGSEDTDYQLAAMFFNFLSTLLDVVPLGTLSTARETAVEWISDGKSHLTAVVLSTVVLEQCRFLLVDSYVRDLFNTAINDISMGTENTLSEKTEKDLKQEKELSGNTTAASLAAKEARIDRTKGFWNSSKWAKNVKRGVSKMFAGDDKEERHHQTGNKGPSPLRNTSSISRKLASGSDKPVVSISVEDTKSTKRQFDSAMYFSLCRAYGIVLARWGGGGRDDIIGNVTAEEALRYKDSEDKKGIATLTADPATISLLNILCFSTTVVRTSWAQTQSNRDIVRALHAVVDDSKGPVPVRLLDSRYTWGASTQRNDGALQLLIFLVTLSHSLIITDDVEVHDMGKPLPIHQLRRCIQLLKKLLYRACCSDTENNTSGLPSNYLGLSLISSSAKAMRDLYDRSSRRPICLPKLWIIDDLLQKEIRRCQTFEDYEKLLTTPVLRICPFLVSFKRRLKLFERIVTTNRIVIQGQHNSNPFSMDSGLKPGIPVRIMRGRVLEDGLLTMNTLGRNMRKRLVVHYLNEAGTEEAGIDVGGLFKEFWTDLCAIAFDPNYALFRVTEGGGDVMYPNPASNAAHGSEHVVLFEFLGRILGKALYEGITIQPQFAHFFLSFLRGDYNFLHMLPDLSTIDTQLYNNLMFLKNYDGDAEDLCLSFTVTNDDFGGNREIPLIPNGEDIAVTNSNKHRYIGLVAKYHVFDRLKDQSEAFTRGLWDVIERPWLRLFNEPELQVLISGPSGGTIDIDDMRANTRYAGGFTGIEMTVNRFWKVMASFNSDQQAALLRFVTSCARPPPLGFASMNPPFTIQRVGILRDGDKLPTASTCFNTLKLPTYSSEKVLRERLLYAIESGAGFELT